jgi:uncharacterized protein YicC (UPF0701 family)
VLKVNEAVTDRYVALLDQLRERYGLDSGLDVRTLATLPDVVHVGAHRALGREETWTLLKSVIEQACDNMNTMKAREGDALAHDLVQRLKLICEQLRPGGRARAAASGRGQVRPRPASRPCSTTSRWIRSGSRRRWRSWPTG